MTLMDVIQDFAVVSMLLAIGYFLRMKVKLFQRLFLPASIIGGLVGLLLGPQLLGLYSPVCVTYTDSIPQWANVLLAVTFACSFLGESMEKITKQAIASTLVSGVVHQAQAILAWLLHSSSARPSHRIRTYPALRPLGRHRLVCAGSHYFRD